MPECQKLKNGGLDEYGPERFVDSFCHNQKNAGRNERVRILSAVVLQRLNCFGMDLRALFRIGTHNYLIM